VRELNTALQHVLNPVQAEEAVVEFGWRFQMRDKVIQTENDYDKDFFNGDIGILSASIPSSMRSQSASTSVAWHTTSGNWTRLRRSVRNSAFESFVPDECEPASERRRRLGVAVLVPKPKHIVGLETVHYYNRVVQKQTGLRRTQQFTRLFMVPGMRHCIGSGGPGPNVFDPLTSLIDRVEKGVAPEQIPAAHFKDNDPTSGIITRTMPPCPYPQVAVFRAGDGNEASNWSCVRRVPDDLPDDE